MFRGIKPRMMRSFVSYQSTKRAKKAPIALGESEQNDRLNTAREVHSLLNRLGIHESDSDSMSPTAHSLKTPGGLARNASVTLLFSGWGIPNAGTNPAEAVLQILEASFDSEGGWESAVRQFVYDQPGDYIMALMCAQDPQKIVLASRGRSLELGRTGRKIIVGGTGLEHIRKSPVRVRLNPGQMAVVQASGEMRFEETGPERPDALVREIQWNRRMIESGLMPQLGASPLSTDPKTPASSDLLILDSGDGGLRVWWKQSESTQGPVCIWKCLSYNALD